MLVTGLVGRPCLCLALTVLSALVNASVDGHESFVYSLGSGVLSHLDKKFTVRKPKKFT